MSFVACLPTRHLGIDIDAKVHGMAVPRSVLDLKCGKCGRAVASLVSVEGFVGFWTRDGSAFFDAEWQKFRFRCPRQKCTADFELRADRVTEAWSNSMVERVAVSDELAAMERIARADPGDAPYEHPRGVRPPNQGPVPRARLTLGRDL